MMRSPILLSGFFLLASACASAPPTQPGPDRAVAAELSPVPLRWTTQDEIESTVVDGQLIVVRADPRVAPLELVNPPDSSDLDISQLASRRGFSVVINAAMFATDYVTSIGYMRNFTHVNNPRLSTKLRGYLMFNPKEGRKSLPAVKVGEKADIEGYETVFQTHRMIDGDNQILWKKGTSIYHQVGLVGVDRQNRVLFFYHPGLKDVHDLVARILELNLELNGLLSLDGGSHGAIYLAPGLGQGRNTRIQLPNLLGLKPKS